MGEKNLKAHETAAPVEAGVEAVRRLMLGSFEEVDQAADRQSRKLSSREQALVDRAKDLAWVDTFEAELLRQAELEASRSTRSGLTQRQNDLSGTRSKEQLLLEQVYREATIPTPRYGNDQEEIKKGD